MKSQALGMIETKGLVSAIEAGDAGVKAANVKLLGYEIVKGGLVMVAFTGEVAAVKASVEAGSAAAARVGQVISEHVIPRPEADIRMVFKGNTSEPENDPPQPDPEGDPPSSETSLSDLTSMTVRELRKLARKMPGISIHGREISRANKDQLIGEILRVRGRKG
ncbi:MAG: BMC domain-containing protein [Bacillota bacterium]|jgi:ethanolamine utilization protein EutM